MKNTQAPTAAVVLQWNRERIRLGAKRGGGRLRERVSKQTALVVIVQGQMN